METPAKRRGGLSPPAAADPGAASPSYFLPELIPLVASRLTNLQDFFALRATCRTYRALLPLSPSNLASQAPHLLLLNEQVGSHTLFSLPLPLRLRFRLPHARLTTAHESDVPTFTNFHTLGRRVAIEDCTDIPRRYQLRILDPLTGETFRFPDLSVLFYRVLLSGDIVLACDPYYDCFFQYCTLGGDKWRLAYTDEVDRFEDLIFVKGILYGLANPGYRLTTIELSDTNVLKLSFLGVELDDQILQNSSHFYLAQCSGELLLISSVRLNQSYDVFRWQIKERKWLRTTSFGGCTLFFYNHCFVGCLGPDHPGIQRDCMYFATWDGYEKWSMYSLIDGSFHEFDSLIDSRERQTIHATKIWVFPSMC